MWQTNRSKQTELNKNKKVNEETNTQRKPIEWYERCAIIRKTKNCICATFDVLSFITLSLEIFIKVLPIIVFGRMLHFKQKWTMHVFWRLTQMYISLDFGSATELNPIVKESPPPCSCGVHLKLVFKAGN